MEEQKKEIITKLEKVLDYKNIIEQNVTEGLPDPNKSGYKNNPYKDYNSVSLETIAKFIEEMDIVVGQYGIVKNDSLEKLKTRATREITDLSFPKLRAKDEPQILSIICKVNSNSIMNDILSVLEVSKDENYIRNKKKYRFTKRVISENLFEYKCDIPFERINEYSTVKLSFFLLYSNEVILEKEIQKNIYLYDESVVWLHCDLPSVPTFNTPNDFFEYQRGFTFRPPFKVVHYHFKDGELKNPRYMYLMDDSYMIKFVNDLSEKKELGSNGDRETISSFENGRVTPSISALFKTQGDMVSYPEFIYEKRDNRYYGSPNKYIEPFYIFFSDNLYNIGQSMYSIPKGEISQFTRFNFKYGIPSGTSYSHIDNHGYLPYAKVSETRTLYDNLNMKLINIKRAEGGTASKFTFKPLGTYNEYIKRYIFDMAYCNPGGGRTYDTLGGNEILSLDENSETYEAYTRSYFHATQNLRNNFNLNLVMNQYVAASKYTRNKQNEFAGFINDYTIVIFFVKDIFVNKDMKNKDFIFDKISSSTYEESGRNRGQHLYYFSVKEDFNLIGKAATLNSFDYSVFAYAHEMLSRPNNPMAQKCPFSALVFVVDRITADKLASDENFYVTK